MAQLLALPSVCVSVAPADGPSVRHWLKSHLPYPLVCAIARATNRPWLGAEHRTERLVEYAWVLRHLVPGRILDYGYAGSYFAEALCQFGTVLGVDPRETPPICHPNFIYWSVDLWEGTHTGRELRFDTIVCVSVLEHYLPFTDTVCRLRAQLAPGGVLLVTVPVGPPQRFKGYRTITEEELAPLGGVIRYRVKTPQGWLPSSAFPDVRSTEHETRALGLLRLPGPPRVVGADPSLGSGPR